MIVDGSLLLIASTEQSTTSERLDADREILDCLFVRLSALPSLASLEVLGVTSTSSGS